MAFWSISGSYTTQRMVGSYSSSRAFLIITFIRIWIVATQIGKYQLNKLMMNRQNGLSHSSNHIIVLKMMSRNVIIINNQLPFEINFNLLPSLISIAKTFSFSISPFRMESCNSLKLEY